MSRRRRVVIGFVTLLASACGGESPSNPTNNPPTNTPPVTQQGCFSVVGNQGTITATITGLANHTGIIASGGANRVTGGPVPTFTIGSLNVQDGTSVIISGQAVVGTSAIGSATINTGAASNSVSVQTRSCSAGTGNWVANVAFGSGSITILSASATGVTGSFSANLEPGPGFTGTKAISGSFSATF
jgi:hypothetical protein